MFTSYRPPVGRRTITGATIAVAALLAAPGTSSARPADNPHATVPAAAVTAAVPSATEARRVSPAGSGAGTLTVLVIAGGTLLVGGATGFEGGRALTRRRAVGS